MLPIALQRRTFGLVSLLGLAAGAGFGTPSRAATDAQFWDLLRAGGCVVLMRHAQTVPGVGDPPGMRLGDCATQRNLSEAGREQARRVGAAFARERIRVEEVRSSAWCRCIDTAELAFGRHTVWAPINSFFQGRQGPEQTIAVLQAVQDLAAPRNLVLVTHQVNITALTGEYLAQGEVIVSRPGARVAPGAPQRLPVLARQVF